MPRINEDRTPMLKTLFQIKTPKPFDLLWSGQQGLNMSESNVLTIVLHNEVMAEHLLADEVFPPYIVKAFSNSKYVGSISFRDHNDALVEKNDVLYNPRFEGVQYTLEINPCFRRIDILRDLYARLKEIADDYIEVINDTAEVVEGREGIEVDFDEKFCWLGAHIGGLVKGPTNSVSLPR